MSHPAKDPNSFFSNLELDNPEEVPLHELEESSWQKSDLHDENFTMMLEVYGSNFQKVWRKTRKKWWT